jgi:pterin-4a-carbinolamine dehydratase
MMQVRLTDGRRPVKLAATQSQDISPDMLSQEASMPTPLTPDEIDHRLAAELPGWSREGDTIRRVYETHGWKGSMLVAGAIAHLAEAAWHHPDLLVTYPRVEVRLTTHEAGGASERDFALARKIEEVVTWRPEPGGALEGTPDDPRFAYLKR